MALTDENGMNTTMLVSPTGGYMGGNSGFGNGFGSDGWWIILLLLLVGGNGWGNGFGGGNGGAGSLYPWMNQAEITSDGFRDQMINNNITSIRDGIGNLSTQLCNCCADMNQTVSNGFAQAEIANNARQMASMNQNFALQSALQECCCENRAGISDLKYTVATENCADRTQSMQNTRDIIENATRNTQAILDKLCQQEIDALKTQNVSLQNQLNMATLRESQTAQNAFIQNGLLNSNTSLLNELRSCPIPSMPVYGMTEIFRCNSNNNGCGCGCGNGF
jgi:hypothetical protein